jgi:putative membrane protein insertion efficiency factor
LIFGVRLYRWTLSPAKVFLFGSHSECRFTPSCSAYAIEAVARHGALAGGWLALKRIGRCHPWGGCGEDQVPEQKSEIRSSKSETNPKGWEFSKEKNQAIGPLFGFRNLNLFRISDFGFRIFKTSTAKMTCNGRTRGHFHHGS